MSKLEVKLENGVTVKVSPFSYVVQRWDSGKWINVDTFSVDNWGDAFNCLESLEDVRKRIVQLA